MHTMNHLSILEEKYPITDTVIADFSEVYTGAKIFDLIDAVMIGNTEKSLKILEKSTSDLDTKNMAVFFASFLTLIRQGVFVVLMRDMGKDKKDISALTGLHPFVIEKHMRSPLSGKKLRNFYQKLLASSIAYKKGN